MKRSVNTEKGDICRILVVKPSSLGDIIHVFPALEVLKKIFPSAEIDFLVNPQFAELLDYSPVPIFRKVIFERKRLGKVRYFLSESLRLIADLRRAKYDLVIDFQGLMRSALFSYLAGARYGVCGFAFPRERLSRLFYRHSAPCKSIHAVDRNVELLDELFGTAYRVPDCVIPANSSVELPAGLPERYTVVLPGARWESKRFPVRLFGEIVRSLVLNGRKVVLAGSSDEEQLCRRIMGDAGNNPDIFNCAGKTGMSQLFEIIRRADAVICNDSGPLHIASIMNKKIFCFFGSTDPAKTGPWNAEAQVYKSKIECSGCLKRECPLKNAPCHELDQDKIINDILNMETTL